MKIERQVEKGLLIGQRLGKTRPESLHLHGPARRTALSDADGEESTEEAVIGEPNGNGIGSRVLTRKGELGSLRRRVSQASVIEELKRQSGVFFDDYEEADGDGEGESEGTDGEGEEEEEEEEAEGVRVRVVEGGGTRVS